MDEDVDVYEVDVIPPLHDEVASVIAAASASSVTPVSLSSTATSCSATAAYFRSLSRTPATTSSVFRSRTPASAVAATTFYLVNAFYGQLLIFTAPTGILRR